MHAFTNCIRHKYFPLFLLISVNLILGALIFKDYGESWDERLRYRYAERSLAAYRGDSAGLVDEKGAFYVMLARLGADVLTKFDDSLRPIEAWHFMHFLAFLMAVFFIYHLCLKFTGKLAAFGAALIFNTQPVLWGHAFINPKDIPFMAFFLGSVVLGMDMVDHYSSASRPVLNRGNDDEGNSGVPRLRQKQTIALVVTSLAALLGLIGLIVFNEWIKDQIYSLVESAYLAGGQGWLGGLFSRLAANSTELPLELYAYKASSLYDRLLPVFVIAIVAAWAGVSAWATRPASTRIWHMRIKPAVLMFRNALVSPRVILAGIFLGLATSIRTLGPASGMLVGIYFVVTAWKARPVRRIIIPVLLAYITLAIIAAFATWPNLWGHPLDNFIHSLTLASDYPWEGKVLFAGTGYPVDAVPWYFLPALFILQTPELTLLVFLIGVGAAILQASRRTLGIDRLLVPTIWMLAPILGVILFRPTIYDNFRQFLFILPPAFLFVGLGLQAIFKISQRWAWPVFVIALLVIPNLYSLYTLHPYQYIYYNQLAGGLDGAFRRYDTDYWATSYKEATGWLNDNLPQDSVVIVWGPSHIIENYARPDLRIVDYSRRLADDLPPGAYVLVSTRHNKDLELFPLAENLHEVVKGEAVLAVVKLLPP